MLPQWGTSAAGPWLGGTRVPGSRLRSPAISATTARSTDAIAAFGVAYADQTERDHAALLAAIRAGRITAGEGHGGGADAGTTS